MIRSLRFLPALLLALPGLNVSAQCTNTVDTDNFSNASAWTATGTGDVTVTGGVVNFNNAQASVYDRVYRPLAGPLSNTYFRARFKFTLGAGPTTGCGANLFSLTAGTLDPISYDNSQSYATTNQDAIVMYISTPTPQDANINNWGAYLGSKDGNTFTAATTSISLTSSTLTYYAEVERTSATTAVLRLYTDAGYSVLYGQSAETISAAITGLTHMSIGVTTWGSYYRYNTLTVDDVDICDNSVAAGCTVLDSDNYSNASSWTATGAGLVTVSGGACTWNGAQCSVYDRVYRPLASTLSDTYFKAEFRFTVQQNPAGQGGGSNLIGFSAGTLDPISYDNSQSYATTNQDGLIILIGSGSTSDNNINNWSLSVAAKDGNTNSVGPNMVSLSSSITTYYIVFERTSTTQTVLSVYTDAAHTALLGQATNSMSAGITGLTHVHHGVTTWGWNTRHLNGTLDDLVICDDLTGISPEPAAGAGLAAYPNPSADGHITIDFAGHEIRALYVYDALGQLVQQVAVTGSAKQAELLLPSGFYLIIADDGTTRYSFRQVVN